MFELMDGLISIVGGVMCYSLANKKSDPTTEPEKGNDWVSKNRKLLKIASPILIIFGAFRLIQVVSML
ncbi:hypothetical protein OPW41_13190 [Vibrio europaeus]|uniref:hypothetical protein n=1 Tax=Vibrio europaeus TaxID=300876 RepID=UPI00233EB0C1|nr:hypothetical protein [Vibrio europaeus]MDC5754732.1 hypothetical protein [Vibrio europaeus]MDC5776666.1 hypothetical protein [Vibrio europaeus]MDC5795786.1 hypothetical protein [Vibrio europaeus]MDC5798415.1 hypothetical protein [Vibrio europaeus]MDC5816464.1 hypothetical protein [Vibrio europaeus]